MADNTKIEWTDATWNPITGCSVISPGCTNCYAMRLAGTRMKHHWSRKGLTVDSKAGPVWNGVVQFNEQWLLQPLAWKRPRLIFVCAHADLFHESVPDEWIDRVFAVMALAPQHRFQVLTKRSARMRQYIDKACGRIADAAIALRKQHGIGRDSGAIPLPHVTPGMPWWPLPNVWLGVSVEDQTRANERIPDLLETPAAVRWISAEPLLGPLDLMKVDVGAYMRRLRTGSDAGAHEYDPDCRWPLLAPFYHMPSGYSTPGIDWVVAGGESGPSARPMHPGWARSLRDQCRSAGVAFHFKQWGEWADWKQLGFAAWHNTTPQRASYRGPILGTFHGGEPHFGGPWETRHVSDLVLARVGKARAGRLLDGVTHHEFPGGAQ